MSDDEEEEKPPVKRAPASKARNGSASNARARPASRKIDEIEVSDDDDFPARPVSPPKRGGRGSRARGRAAGARGAAGIDL